jgi:hypothetical protein
MTPIDTCRWIVAVAMLAAFVLPAGMNTVIVLTASRRTHFISCVPGSALFGMIAVAAVPLSGAWKWLWVPVVLDVTAMMGLVCVALWALHRWSIHRWRIVVARLSRWGRHRASA